MTGSEEPSSFRLAYVPGVTPAKWVRIWQERLPDIPLELVAVSAAEAPGLLLRGDADAGFVRLPVDRTDLSAIPLYTETTVVVIPKDHLMTAVDEVSAEDLADEIVFHPLDDTLDWERPPGLPAIDRPATTADAVELVAAGVGLLVVPQSLARLHHRRDLTYRPVTDLPQSRVALSWPEERTTDLVEDFIGIVRGRTVNSTRGRRPAAATEQPKAKGADGAGTQRRTGAGKAAGKASGRTSGKSAGRPTRRGSGGGQAGGGGRGRGKPRRRS
ncbi:LysR family substrate-binding domain-containing protein [Streptomyces sp. TRM49041]|uniref:LysR family substrate-binding domain-containing protein n=1 Tax=Streptomyces sp. TRM49041 TaxID=2603216 RepID=UPI0011EFC5BD|nr:LysR family substrate-binding domain-containing protein [Streptomyces sp. TRM49041]